MYPQIVFIRDKMPVLIDRAKELQILSPHWVLSIGKEAKFISTLEDKLRATLPRLISQFGVEATKEAAPDWEWDWKRNCWRVVFRIPIREVEMDHEVVLLSACTYQTGFGWRVEEMTGGSRDQGVLPAK
ncbi:hypothetical protein W97_02606 [Coniosporium apollinis CBS 100218]|uniref:Uncharacterized protein n=1 Tax=Coniosporium apollinis (strain CBS 100218) TaxID=1168221 RepID=R7YNI6_CONA1|nr:uncharacterized protein W97_02606 [Coniosporium apollinis CBS 100218]EON63379.1 hypothetical protein W97_02606 [Coniosporium apollinis CBS 100218]